MVPLSFCRFITNQLPYMKWSFDLMRCFQILSIKFVPSKHNHMEVDLHTYMLMEISTNLLHGKSPFRYDDGSSIPTIKCQKGRIYRILQVISCFPAKPFSLISARNNFKIRTVKIIWILRELPSDMAGATKQGKKIRVNHTKYTEVFIVFCFIV